MFVRTEELDRLVDKALDRAFELLGEAALVPFVLVELPDELGFDGDRVPKWTRIPFGDLALGLIHRTGSDDAKELGLPSSGAIDKRERWFAKAIDNALARSIDVCPSCGAKLK